MGDPDTIKTVAFLSATTQEPGSLDAPLYDSQTAAGTSRAPTPPLVPPLPLGTGLECLPAGVEGERLTLTNKLKVLNCLVFSTPHSFWVAESLKTIDNNALKASGRFNWINYGDWRCSSIVEAVKPVFNGPVPSCLKHDVGYSLQRFAGGAPDGAWDTELDEAWNPRNKALADLKFKADIMKYGCQNPSAVALISVCRLSNKDLAENYFWGVAHVNHKGWPVTQEDIHHVEAFPQFLECGGPKIVVGDSGFSHQSDWTFTVDWQIQRGCVQDLAIQYEFCLSIEFDHVPGARYFSSCWPTILSNSATSATLTLPSLFGWDEKGATYFLYVYLRPRNIDYGGEGYPQSFTYRIER